MNKENFTICVKKACGVRNEDIKDTFGFIKYSDNNISEFFCKKILITIDITPSVLDECKEKKIDTIITYHEPFYNTKNDFNGVKHEDDAKEITKESNKEKIEGLERKLKDLKRNDSSESSSDSSSGCTTHRSTKEKVKELKRQLKELKTGNSSDGSKKKEGKKDNGSTEETKKEIESEKSKALEANKGCDVKIVDEVKEEFLSENRIKELLSGRNIKIFVLHTVLDKWMCHRIAKNLDLAMTEYTDFYTTGINKRTISDLLKSLKKMLEVKILRYSIGYGRKTSEKPRKVILGMGKYQKSFKKEVDNSCIIITGEMEHHQTLEYQNIGVSVILTEHTVMERFYLKKFDKRFNEEAEVLAKELKGKKDKDLIDLKNFKTRVSKADCDPVLFY